MWLLLGEGMAWCSTKAYPKKRPKASSLRAWRPMLASGCLSNRRRCRRRRRRRILLPGAQFQLSHFPESKQARPRPEIRFADWSEKNQDRPEFLRFGSKVRGSAMRGLCPRRTPRILRFRAGPVGWWLRWLPRGLPAAQCGKSQGVWGTGPPDAGMCWALAPRADGCQGYLKNLGRCQSVANKTVSITTARRLGQPSPHHLYE